MATTISTRRVVKNPLGPAAVLDADYVYELLKRCGKRSPSGQRNRALILILWRAGLRINEALTLEPKDVHLDGRDAVITVRHAKGGKQRTVGVHQEAEAALRKWLETRSRLDVDRGRRIADRRVFCTIGGKNGAGKQIQSSYVRHLLRRLAREIAAETGMELRRCHPHGFRATLAVELASEGKSMTAIRDVLGHSSIAVSDRYLRRTRPADAIDAVCDRDAINAGGRVLELRKQLDALSADELRDLLTGALGRAA